MGKKDILEIIENAMSWIVVLAMYIYGSFKLVQFRGAASINTPVSETSGLELMWAFYGYSKPYIIILGILEIIGGTLILFKRTRIIGCVFTSTILLNIVLQDYFYSVPALKAAIFYQIILCIILWLNKEQLIAAINVMLKQQFQDHTSRTKVIKLFIAFILFILLRIFEYIIT